MTDYWMSWYSPAPLCDFELHSPWWQSGWDSEDRPIIVAAVRAEDEDAAIEQVINAYDEPPSGLDMRFCDEMQNKSPFSDRFPQAEWMRWNAISTCGCHVCDLKLIGT